MWKVKKKLLSLTFKNMFMVGCMLFNILVTYFHHAKSNSALHQQRIFMHIQCVHIPLHLLLIAYLYIIHY